MACAVPAPTSEDAPGCSLCGHPDVTIDEVFHSGTLYLAECRHCEHRWTWRPMGADHVQALGAMSTGRRAVRSVPPQPGERPLDLWTAA